MEEKYNHQMEDGMEKKRFCRKGRGVKKFFFFLVFLGVCAGIAAVVMLLWNAIVPPVIGWAVIGYWQALGLMVLCRLLFGGFGKMHGLHNHWHHHRERKQEFQHIHEKMCRMSKDQRREFIRRRMAGMDEPLGPDQNTTASDENRA